MTTRPQPESDDLAARICYCAGGSTGCGCTCHLAAIEAAPTPAIPGAHPESIGPTGLLVGRRPSEVGTATVDLAAPTPAIDRDTLAKALMNTVGKHGWLHVTPPDPVIEWRENAAMVMAEYAALAEDTGETP